MKISLPSVLTEHRSTLRQGGLNISPNFYITLKWGSAFLLFSTSVVRFSWLGPSPPSLSNFLSPFNFAANNFAQMGVDVPHLP